MSRYRFHRADFSGPSPTYPQDPPCPACLGEGEWFRYQGEGDGITVPCDICDGSGTAPIGRTYEGEA